ncbi:hypothetical protein PIB30_099121 [Stylosanthes scabra]|uniref:Uncharacterized protein n=1 Tax=Stylosanthes scabra TaxID=79078 RepID=A0ABU6TZ31_9FABA|nr:hypothetical protein [Stylosanthes scabra]
MDLVTDVVGLVCESVEDLGRWSVLGRHKGVHHRFGPSGPNVRNSSPRAWEVGRFELPSLTILQIMFLTLFVLRRSDILIARRLLVAALALEKLLGGAFLVLTADTCTFPDRGERELRCPLVFRNNDGG